MNIKMNRFSKVFFVILFFITAGLIPIAAEGKGNGEKIVARVNGTTLSARQLTAAVTAHQNKLKKSAKATDMQQIPFRTKRNILDKMINQVLLVQASQSISIPDIEKRVEAVLAAKEKKAQSDMHFARYLETKNMTRQTYAKELKNKIHMSEYLKKQGIAEAVVPENEIKEFYEKGSGLQREETVKVRHILLKVKKGSIPDEKNSVRKQALELIARINGGEDFAVIARQYSQCQRSKEQGGDLGYIKRGYMPEPFDEAAFSLARGTVSKLIETEFGFHVLQVLDKKEAGRIPYDEAREFLKKYLQERKMPQLLEKHMEELRKRADIEIYLNENQPT